MFARDDPGYLHLPKDVFQLRRLIIIVGPLMPNATGQTIRSLGLECKLIVLRPKCLFPAQPTRLS
jgi:hypothetical protein